MLRDTRQRLLEIRQMLAIINASIPHNVHGQHAVFEIRLELFEHEGLVDGGAHGEGIVAGSEGEVGEGAGAEEEGGAGDVGVECYVALIRNDC